MAHDFGKTILDFDRMQPPRLPPGALRYGLVALLALLVVVTSFYQVDPEETGVVLRFGAYHGETAPGLHWKLPLGIDQVVKVPIQRQLAEEFGLRAATVGAGRTVTEESNMLTGDLNAATVEWVVQYRIADAYRFLFAVRNVRETFRDMSEAVIREVVGDRTVNEVLTVGRQEIAEVVHEKLQVLCTEYDNGIVVDQVILQDVTPPEPVKPAFNEVNQSQQEREKRINEAQSEYNKVVPRAQGEAQQTIQGAEGYALDRVNRARGEASRFEALYAEYRQAPEVTRRRIYLETLGQVLPGAGRKVIVDDDLRGLLPLLEMGGGESRRAPAAPPGGGG